MSTTKELEAYAKGFKDGWAAAQETGFKSYPPVTLPTPTLPQPQSWEYMKCHVCGRIGIDNMVCWNHNCPSKVTCGTGAIGAPVNVGVGGIGTISPATNGPTGEWK